MEADMPAGMAAGMGAIPAAPAGIQPAMPGAASAPPPSESDGPAVATTVLNVGKKTFFQRNNRWEDSALTEEQIQNAQQIERYSDAYFALSRKYGKDVAKYLALEGRVLVLLGDQAYEF